jgi:hypothetical protein
LTRRLAVDTMHLFLGADGGCIPDEVQAVARNLPSVVAVVTADVVASSTYSPADRRRLDGALRRAFRTVERRFSRALLSRPAFRITAGDEFQFVVSDVPEAFRVVTYLRALVAAAGLRPPIRLRAGIGVGEIAITGRLSSYEGDGVAFQLARLALEQAGGTRGLVRWTSLTTGVPEVDDTANILLLLIDRMEQGWTGPQWEAIRWSLLGRKREWIGRRLGIAHQNVTKRLSAAGWPYFEPALDFVGVLLSRACAPDRVHGSIAPSRR